MPGSKVLPRADEAASDELVEEAWDVAGGPVLTQDFPRRAGTTSVEDEEFVKDKLAGVAQLAHFRDGRQPPRPIGETRLLDDDVDARRDLLANASRRQL